MKSVAVVGAQWGDEGKGKVVDYLSGSFDYIARVAGGRDAGRQAVDVGGAADLVEHPLALELGGDGQRVDRLGAVLQREHGLEDLLVLREVEILRAQADVDLDLVEHALGDEDGAQHRDLGLEVLQREPVGSAVLVERRYDCHVAEEAGLAGRDDGLDGRGDAIVHLDRDHVGSRVADRLLQVDLATVEPQAAGLADRVDDLLSGDRAEQAAVVAGGMRDRQHRLGEQRRVLLRLVRRLPRRALGSLAAALRLRDRPGRGRLGELARDEEVAQIAGRDVYDVAPLPERLHVLQQDRLRHRCYAWTSDPKRTGAIRAPARASRHSPTGADAAGSSR